MKVYISGPMTGMPALNFPAFHAAEAALREIGVEPVNPATLNPNPNASWRECMAVDIKALVDCDAVLMLDGWTRSKGARLEWDIALRLGLKDFRSIDEVRTALVLDKARAA